MIKITLLSVIAATMSMGMVANSQAQQRHSSRSIERMNETRMAAPRDFQALAPVAREVRGLEGQDPLDYHLGYFRNF